jgi:hypothetical protein
MHYQHAYAANFTTLVVELLLASFVQQQRPLFLLMLAINHP